MPRFSIVIPVFNRADLVERTLESIYAQTFTDYEVIAVDDGSSDHSVQVLRRHEPRVRVLAEPNRGVSATRNAGVRASRGEYIAFLDSDDLWFPWTLEVIDRALRDHGNPAWLAGGVTHFVDESEFAAQKHANSDPPRVITFADYLSSWQGRPDLCVGAVAIRRDAYDAAGGFTELRMNAEDTELWIKLGTAKGHVRVIAPLLLAVRRGHTSSITNLGNGRKGLAHLVEQERAGAYPGGEARKWERCGLIAAHHRAFCMTALKARDFETIAETFWRSFGWNLRLGRLRFLLGFPIMWLAARLRGGKRSEGRKP